ncbi:MAG: hypothetical protein AAGE98_11570 [Actinomycetota bacterium]
MSDDSIRLLQGPPARQWIGWIMWAMHFGWAIRDWISVIDVGVSFGFAVLAIALRRGLRRRGLWVTNEEIIISNTEQMHVIPIEGSSAKLMRTDNGFWAHKPDFDNTQTAQLKLWVIPADRTQPRVAVDAGLGLTPPKLRRLEAELQAAILDAA